MPPPLVSSTAPPVTLAETQTRISQAPPARPPPILPGKKEKKKNINFTRFSCSRLVKRLAQTCLDHHCLVCSSPAQHVVSYIQSTQRHSHACFCAEPAGSSAACCKVSWHYAGDGSLRLERHSPKTGQGRPRIKRPSAGDGSPCFERRSPQLRRYSGDRSLRLEHRSPHPWHRSPRTKRRSPQPCAARQ